jgi:hypothetical protein
MARVASGITIIPGITHTSLVDDEGTIDVSCNLIANNPTANLLALRTMNQASQIISLNGRLSGQKLDLTKFSFNDYEMRRKAETLQYRKNQSGFSKKKQYSQISNIGGLYSIQVLRRLTQPDLNNCPNPNINQDVIIRPPTNSGVRDYKFSGYYYDARIPYLNTL